MQLRRKLGGNRKGERKVEPCVRCVRVVSQFQRRDEFNVTVGCNKDSFPFSQLFLDVHGGFFFFFWKREMGEFE